MKKLMIVTVTLFGFLVFSGCSTQSGNITDLASDSTPDITSPITPDPAPDNTDPAPEITPASKRDAIPFEAGQLYAVAYLGYQTADGRGYYAQRYLDSDIDEFDIRAVIGQWLTSGYSLAMAIIMPLTAFLINRFLTLSDGSAKGG